MLLGERKSSSVGLGVGRVAGIGGKVADLPGKENEPEEEALRREVAEEILVDLTSFREAGTTLFLFPDKPKWNETVKIYIADAWKGQSGETDEIVPSWFDINSLPFDRMWADAPHWIPLVLRGKKVRATFMYGPDNASLKEYKVEVD